jgi:hypothetical protein
MPIKTLPCKLTDEEKLARGKDLADQVQTLAAHEDAAKDAAKEASKRKKAIEKEIVRLSDVVHAGVEPREVICREEVEGTMVRLIRTDTNEQVDIRAQTEAERQGDLFKKTEAAADGVIASAVDEALANAAAGEAAAAPDPLPGEPHVFDAAEADPTVCKTCGAGEDDPIHPTATDDAEDGDEDGDDARHEPEPDAQEATA